MGPESMPTPPSQEDKKETTSLLKYESNPKEIEPNMQIEKKETDEYEKYHDIKKELERHKFLTSKNFLGHTLRMDLARLGEDYNPMTREIKYDVVSPQEITNFIIEQKSKEEKDFLDSLNNQKEQEVRKEVRQDLIDQLESVYNSLDKQKFFSEDSKIRREELMRVLDEKGIAGRDRETQKIIESLYKFSTRDKEQFIENALTEFDPLIFKEAQKKVLGYIKEDFDELFESKVQEIKKQKLEKAKEAKEKEKEDFLREIRERIKKY